MRHRGACPRCLIFFSLLFFNLPDAKRLFITEVVIAVRNDISRNSWAWKCYELISTGQENGMINATGYVAGKLND